MSSAIIEKEDLKAISGRVLDGQIWSQSHVSGGGGGVMIGGVGVASSNTTTRVVDLYDLCIEDTDGVQHIFRLPADRVRIAQGQSVTIVCRKWGIEDKPLILFNHSMKKRFDIQSYWEADRRGYALMALYAIASLALFALAPGDLTGFFLLGNVPAVVIGFWMRHKYYSRLEAFVSELEASSHFAALQAGNTSTTLAAAE